MFVLVVGLMVVPLQMALIPILRLYTSGASIGGVAGVPGPGSERHVPRRLARPHRLRATARRSTCLRNYIGSLPSSIIESAQIDGADHFTIFWRLIVPLSVPALAAFAIFQFLWVWNDLLVAYVFLGGTRTNRVLTSRSPASYGVARRGLAPAHRRGVHLDGAPAHRVLLAAALLRAGPHRGLGEGLSRCVPRGDADGLAGVEPLSPQRKWRAITLATLLLVPAYWSMLAGLVAVAADEDAGADAGRRLHRLRPRACIPFVFIVLAFLSEHPERAGGGRQGDGARACSSASRSRRSRPTP